MPHDILNLNGPVHPLTDDQQHYRRLREAEQQRFAEHANYVNQAYQVRRTNERQQFRERMQKCPVALPPKRLSPRTPPPDLKLSMTSTHSPHRQWSLNEQTTKSSPDPSMINSQSNGSLNRDAGSQQFVQNGNQFRQMNPGFAPNFQDPRLQLHHQQMQAFYAQQVGAQFPMSNNGQPPFPPMQYGHPDLIRLQMVQQQWAAGQQQFMQGQFMASQASVNSAPPSICSAPQFPLINKPPAMLDPKRVASGAVNQAPAQVNGLQFKQQFWNPNQQHIPQQQQQFCTPASIQQDSFHPQVGSNSQQQLNFMPSTPTQSALDAQKPASAQQLNEAHVPPRARVKSESDNVAASQPMLSRVVPNEQPDDDILELYSTIGTDEVADQDISKYLDNFSNIEAYNFAHIGNTDISQLPERTFLNN